MEHPSLFIAIDLVEDADVEHPVVENQEDERPFHKGPVEAFDSFLDKGGFIVEVTCGEEKAGSDEEQGHVELEDELTEPARCLCMGDDHQYDGDTLRHRNNGIAG